MFDLWVWYELEYIQAIIHYSQYDPLYVNEELVDCNVSPL